MATALATNNREIFFIGGFLRGPSYHEIVR
jgi:hypothetical protein